MITWHPKASSFIPSARLAGSICATRGIITAARTATDGANWRQHWQWIPLLWLLERLCCRVIKFDVKISHLPCLHPRNVRWTPIFCLSIYPCFPLCVVALICACYCSFDPTCIYRIQHSSFSLCLTFAACTQCTFFVHFLTTSSPRALQIGGSAKVWWGIDIPLSMEGKTLKPWCIQYSEYTYITYRQ